jgi:hypothetical protein
MVNITTALFDIKRNTSGDGRTMDQYLEWFDATLAIDSNMTIYTEPMFLEFVKSRRSEESTNIICSKLEDIPYYHLLPPIENILSNSTYRKKINDSSRIECNLPLYNIIQYSKFKWISKSIESDRWGSNFYFWMDAGCSRFFNANSTINWPDEQKIEPGKLNIQGNINTRILYNDLDPNVYKWNNNCILVGTLFGGDPEIMNTIEYEIERILIDEMISEGMINNEQIALGMLYKRKPDLFSVYIDTNSGHLPLFGHLSK